MSKTSKTGKLYTLGIWVVKPGYEKDFISAWKEFAHWTIKNQDGAVSATLVQDIQNSQRFISFGPWEDKESIELWRQTPVFQAFIKKARALCDDIQPHTVKSVATVS